MRVLKKLVPALFLFSVFALNTSAQESKKNDDVFFIVENMPVYPGGDEQIRKDISNLVEYPKYAQENGIQGKVYVTFIVNAEGKISASKIARGVDSALDQEALRVVNALDKTWKPGTQKGKAVKVSYTIPINFALGGGKTIETKKATVAKNKGDVYYIVEEMPVYPGGDPALRDFIAKNVKYPEKAQEKGIQGRVYVTFIVDVDGSITGAKIARGVDPSLDNEAIRVVNSSPKWTPGKQDGEAVKVSYTVPITFALQ